MLINSLKKNMDDLSTQLNGTNWLLNMTKLNFFQSNSEYFHLTKKNMFGIVQYKVIQGYLYQGLS